MRTRLKIANQGFLRRESIFRAQEDKQDQSGRGVIIFFFSDQECIYGSYVLASYNTHLPYAVRVCVCVYVKKYVTLSAYVWVYRKEEQ